MNFDLNVSVKCHIMEAYEELGFGVPNDTPCTQQLQASSDFTLA